MKRLYATLKLFLGCSIGVFLGRCIYLYFDFKVRPDLYAMQSAPWYADLKFQGIITAVLAAIGTGRNAKRTTIIHLSFNLIGTVVFLSLIHI